MQRKPVTPRFAWLAAAGWTLAVVLSLAWNVLRENREVIELARAEAISNFNKDITFRRWGTEHGGVYVPVTPRQAPVPWLAHLPERDVVAPDGRRLTLLNPASMLRQMMERYSRDYGVRGRITGLRQINPANAPDDWEREQLHRFERGEVQAAWTVEELDGAPHLRYLRALYMEPGCVKCHGDMGYREGDLRGAIGVSVPLAPYLANRRAALLDIGVSHGLFWLFGLTGIGIGARVAARQERERLHLYAALEESRTRLQLALEGANDGIWDVDLLRGDVFHSPRMAEMLGYRAGELGSAEEIWMALVHPDDLPALLRAKQAHLDGKTERYEVEFRARAKDGTWRWIHSRGRMVRNAAGEPARFVGVHTDVTEFKALQQRLFLEKERAEVTLASIADAVITTDAEGNVTFMNGVAERLTGWREADALGLPADTIAPLYDESSGVMIDSPVARAGREKRAVEPGGHALLLNRRGDKLPVDETAAPILAGDGTLIGVVMVFYDVSHTRELTRRMSWQLTHDELTGLYSRREFDNRLRRLVQDARAGGGVHALLYLDLDQFKIVNDTSGHLAGDELLKQLGFLLSEQMRRNDVLARLGGDEFAALLEHCPPEKAREIAEKLRRTVADFRFTWQDRVFDVGVSIGLVMLDADTPGAEEALVAADTACYAAKEAGRNRVHEHRRDADDGGERLGEMHLAASMRQALARDAFVLFTHEIRDLAHSGCPPCYEVLARMQDERGSLIQPGMFIPAAERYGLMPELDRWIVRRSFELLAAASAAMRATMLFINLSGLSLREDGMVRFIRDAARENGIEPANICFEITETAAVAQLAVGVRFMRELREVGFRFALDDFGAGMSSFAYLKNLPVDFIKIDGGFVRDMLEDPVDRVFVETIHRIGRLMGKRTIAEFIENDALLAEARAIGIDFAQGYAVGKPRPLDAVLAGY